MTSGKEALGEPFSAFPSWFLRIECDRQIRFSCEERRGLVRGGQC
jgi:hypothetical protein